MVILWLMMVNHNNLVGGFNLPLLKNDGVSSSLGMMKYMKFPTVSGKS